MKHPNCDIFQKQSANDTVEIKKIRNQISIGLKQNNCTFIVHSGHCYNLEGVGQYLT